ncbi:recombinase family protein [Nonomuraea sp. KM88]|uniref:recombinase family protein n=1 Tax=Nonomuraea sp. KM88 TaxID=3457427 RepID=UPI003FCEAB13
MNSQKVPHPVAAKRAEGRSKTRLVPHPVEGPTVTHIFMLRAVHRLGYDAIADKLNIEPEKYPPPTPVDPRRALGRWSGSSVREILANPKYTGYMVWNRRATKKGGKNNPSGEWIWSPRPTHEPLVTKELFQAVSSVGKIRERSRGGSEPNSHPQTSRTYSLRSYVFCEICDHQMHGKSRNDVSYYACKAGSAAPQGSPRLVRRPSQEPVDPGGRPAGSGARVLRRSRLQPASPGPTRRRPGSECPEG